MSVIFFDAEELGNVAALIAAPSMPLTVACANLAAFSVVNARAYSARYPKENKAEPYTAQEIALHARKSCDRDAAVATVGLLNYNCHEANPTTDELQNTMAIVVAALRASAKK
jgi:hypothetical protein